MANILMEKTAGVPNVVWAGAAVAAAFLLSRFAGGLGGAAPAASAAGTSTGQPPAPGPTGSGVCPAITPVQCGSGESLVYGVDANGCPTQSCQPSPPIAASHFITVCTDMPCGTTISQVLAAYGLSDVQFKLLNANWDALGQYNENLPGNIDHMEIRVA